MSVYVAFDIGGTNMRVAVGSDTELGEVKKVPTPKDPREAVSVFVHMARELAGEHSIVSVAGGIRWIIKDDIFQPGDLALPGWAGFNVRHELAVALSAPVKIVHDTAAVGLGEVHAGAGKGSNICAYITVSTGVGGDRIVDGKIDRATFNPEIGKQAVEGDWLENQVSGSAVREKYGIEPKDLESIEDRNKLAEILAVGLYNTTLHWSPDTIVLGGSMIVGKNPIPLQRTEETLHALLDGIYPQLPAVKMAELGDNGGLHGGLVLARELQAS